MRYKIIVDTENHLPVLTHIENIKMDSVQCLTTKTYETKGEAQQDVEKFILFQKTSNHYTLSDVPNINVRALSILLGE